MRVVLIVGEEPDGGEGQGGGAKEERYRSRYAVVYTDMDPVFSYYRMLLLAVLVKCPIHVLATSKGTLWLDLDTPATNRCHMPIKMSVEHPRYAERRENK